MTSSKLPPRPPNLRIIVRQNAPRPLPALFAIVVLVSAMMLVSLAMSKASASNGTPTVAAEASFDEIPR